MIYNKKDEELKSGVLFQLGWDSRVRQTEIGVIVKDGVVTLTGTVGSYARSSLPKKQRTGCRSSRCRQRNRSARSWGCARHGC